MKVVEIVQIAELIKIYKNNEEANAIEVARVKDLNGEICMFNIIVQKNLYNINDYVVYIQPDYCLPNTSIFSDYTHPNGDEKKSKLGGKNRIKAVKFNFNFENEFDSIYSNGILLPISETNLSLEELTNIEDLQEHFKITKYVADDNAESNGSGKGVEFPSFLYKTDEDRIENCKGKVDRLFDENEILSFTDKRDGSSSTIYVKNVEDFKTYGICSRKEEKVLDLEYVVSYTDSNGCKYHRYFNKELNTAGWKCDENDKFYTLEEIETIPFESKEIKMLKCDFVDTANKHNYFNKLLDYCEKYNIEWALRGELVGAGNKGSGKTINSDSKTESKIIFFGVDDLSGGYSNRLNYSDTHNLEKVCNELDLEYTKVVFCGVFNYNEIIRKCNEYFKHIKETENRIIEGVVIRSKYSNRLSVKYINPEYDIK